MNPSVIQDCIHKILVEIEGEPLRPDLQKTPLRFFRTYEEMLDGYDIDVSSLFSTFEGEGQDQIVANRDIHFWSTCEHHLLPFSAKCHVAYLPIDKVIGASKIERLVLVYAHRLQLQERITRQVAEAMMKYLIPRGVAVIIIGKHLCMRCRGVKSDSSELVTSVMLGEFREDSRLRAEVIAMLSMK